MQVVTHSLRQRFLPDWPLSAKRQAVTLHGNPFEKRQSNKHTASIFYLRLAEMLKNLGLIQQNPQILLSDCNALPTSNNFAP